VLVIATPMYTRKKSGP